MRAMGHTPSQDTLEDALDALNPHLPRLLHFDAALLLEALDGLISARTPACSFGLGDYLARIAGPALLLPAAAGAPLLPEVSAATAGSREPRASGLPLPPPAPSQLPPSAAILRYLRICEWWRAPLADGVLDALEAVVEQLMPALPQASVQPAQEGGGVMAQQRSPQAGPTAMQHGQLLSGVLLPLGRLGQSFKRETLFKRALSWWSGRGFEGLEGMGAGAAAVLLRSYARRARAWSLDPDLVKDLCGLTESALSTPHTNPADLSALLLAAARFTRVIQEMAAGVESQEHSSEEVGAAAPFSIRAAPLVLRAIEQLMQLRPSADDVAAAAQALWLERVDWAPPTAEEVRGLLERLLHATRSSLSACQLQSSAGLLAVCAAAGYRPDAVWRTECFNAARKRLLGSSAAALQALPTDLFLGLFDSLEVLETLSPTAAEVGISSDNGDQQQRSSQARGQLVASVLAVLVQRDGMEADQLARAVRQAGRLGWQADSAAAGRGLTRDCCEAVMVLLPDMSLEGVAAAAEGVAGRGEVPDLPELLETLLTSAREQYHELRRGTTGGVGQTCAEGAEAGCGGLAAVGLVLGSAHRLLQQASAAGQGQVAERSAVATISSSSSSYNSSSSAYGALSLAALEAWRALHTALVTGFRVDDVWQRYDTQQLQSVVGALAAWELVQQQNRVGGGLGGGVGGRSVTGAVEAVDLLGSGIEVLLQRRQAAVRTVAAVVPCLLPPPALLVDLLHLLGPALALAPITAASTLRPEAAALGAGTACGNTGASVTARVADYVRVSMSDLALVSTQLPCQGEQYLRRAEWSALLRAALAAGLQPGVPELRAYCAALTAELGFASDAGSGDRAVRAGRSGLSSGSQLIAEEARRLWAEVEGELRSVLLPVLPWHAETGEAGEALRRVFPPLEHANMAQLGLMSTYWCQARLGTKEDWARVKLDLLRRLRGQQGTAQRGGAGSAGAAAETGTTGSSATSTGLTAVCYCLQLQGISDTDLESWMERMPEASTDALSIGQPSGMPQQEIGSSSKSVGATQRAVSALQLLWAADRRGALASVEADVWEAAYSSAEVLEDLLPQQLAQLLFLHAARARGPGDRGAVLQPDFAESLLLHLTAHFHVLEQLRPATQHNRGSADAGGAVAAGAAALAIRFCLMGPDGRLQAPPPLTLLRATPLALGRSEILPLRDAVALLLALQNDALPPLPEHSLRALVARLAGPSNVVPPAGMVVVGSSSSGSSSSSSSNADSGHDREVFHVAPEEAVKLVRAVVRITPRTLNGLAALEPLLQRLLPEASLELRAMVAAEQAERAVATGLLEAAVWGTAPEDQSGRGSVVTAEQGPAALTSLSQSQAAQPQLLPPAAPSSSSSEALETVRPEIWGFLAQELLQAASSGTSSNQDVALYLLRLLSVDGVAQLLPASDLRLALSKRLLDCGEPMPDTTVAAINAALGQPASPLEQLQRALQLQRCGANPVHFQRARAAMLSPAGLAELRSLSEAPLAQALADMDVLGLGEQVHPTAAAPRSNEPDRGLNAVLPLEDLVALLLALQDSPLPPLPQRSVRELVARLVGPYDDTATAAGSSANAGRGHGSDILHTVPEQAVQLVQVVVRIASKAPEGPAVATPLLERLLPGADMELWEIVTAEQAGRAVVATGLQAAMCGTALEVQSSSDTGACAAEHASSALAVLIGFQAARVQSYRMGDGDAPCTEVKLLQGGVASVRPDVWASLALELVPACNSPNSSEYLALYLLRLLSIDGVAQLLPASELQLALNNRLLYCGAPMPDVAVTAIDAALGQQGRSPLQNLQRASQLHHCGAHPVHVQRALVALLEPAALPELRSLGVKDLALVLAKVDACGVREPVRPSAVPHLGDPDPYADADAAADRDGLVAALLEDGWQRENGPRSRPPHVLAQEGGPFTRLAALAVRLLARRCALAVTTAVKGSGGTAVRPADVAVALQHLAAVQRRLPALLTVRFWQDVANIAEWAVGRQPNGVLEAAVRHEPEGAWQLLEALFALGGGRCVDACVRSMNHRIDRAFTAPLPAAASVLSTAPDALTQTQQPVAAAPVWRSRYQREETRRDAVEAATANTADMAFNLERTFGPYLLKGSSALRLFRALGPQLKAHKAALEDEVQDSACALYVRFPGRAPGSRALDYDAVAMEAVFMEATAGMLQELPTDPRALSARKLGLLCGLVAAHSPVSSAGRSDELLEARDSILPTYKDMLGRVKYFHLLNKLPALDHLTAVLDAVEPIVCWEPQLVERPYYRAMAGVIKLALAQPLECITKDPVREPPALSGPRCWAELSLVRLPVDLDSEEALLAALYDRPAAAVAGQEEVAAIAEELLPRVPLVMPLGLGFGEPGEELGLSEAAMVLRRHGLGLEPAAEAAREAAVMELSPWLLAARRLHRCVAAMEATPSPTKALRYSLCSPDNRWALLLAMAVEPSMAACKQCVHLATQMKSVSTVSALIKGVQDNNIAEAVQWAISSSPELQRLTGAVEQTLRVKADFSSIRTRIRISLSTAGGDASGPPSGDVCSDGGSSSGTSSSGSM